MFFCCAEELERSKRSLLEERERFKDRVGRLQQQQQQLLEEHEEQQQQRQQEQQRRTAWSQSPSKANNNRTDTNITTAILKMTHCRVQPMGAVARSSPPSALFVEFANKLCLISVA